MQTLDRLKKNIEQFMSAVLGRDIPPGQHQCVYICIVFQYVI